MHATCAHATPHHPSPSCVPHRRPHLPRASASSAMLLNACLDDTTDDDGQDACRRQCLGRLPPCSRSSAVDGSRLVGMAGPSRRKKRRSGWNVLWTSASDPSSSSLPPSPITVSATAPLCSQQRRHVRCGSDILLCRHPMGSLSPPLPTARWHPWWLVSAGEAGARRDGTGAGRYKGKPSRSMQVAASCLPITGRLCMFRFEVALINQRCCSLLSLWVACSSGLRLPHQSDQHSHLSNSGSLPLARSSRMACSFNAHLVVSAYFASSSPIAQWKIIFFTDSLFSMDGDFAPLPELVKLHRKHAFLLFIDDAHKTLVCGGDGGDALEQFECESDINISVGYS